MAAQATDITIGGRVYRLAVPAEQVEHLKALALRVEAIFGELKQADPYMDRDHQLVMTCLQLVGELDRAQTDFDDTLAATGRLHRTLAERLEQLLPR